MQCVDVSPHLGAKPVSEVTVGHVEALAGGMLEQGSRRRPYGTC